MKVFPSTSKVDNSCSVQNGGADGAVVFVRPSVPRSPSGLSGPRNAGREYTIRHRSNVNSRSDSGRSDTTLVPESESGHSDTTLAPLRVVAITTAIPGVINGSELQSAIDQHDEYADAKELLRHLVSNLRNILIAGADSAEIREARILNTNRNCTNEQAINILDSAFGVVAY